MTDRDMFQPYKKLVEIDIRGKRRRVPENNSLLRGFQFLSMESISYGDFCWNGECVNCRVWLDMDGTERAVMACRTTAVENLKIVRMAKAIDLTDL